MNSTLKAVVVVVALVDVAVGSFYAGMYYMSHYYSVPQHSTGNIWHGVITDAGETSITIAANGETKTFSLTPNTRYIRSVLSSVPITPKGVGLYGTVTFEEGEAVSVTVTRPEFYYLDNVQPNNTAESTTQP